MKVTTNNGDYELDLEQALKLGVCKKIFKTIESFNVGDIFTKPNFGKILIVQADYGYHTEEQYNFAGYDGLDLYSAFANGARTKKEILEYLNSNELMFVKNINKEIAKLIEDC